MSLKMASLKVHKKYFKVNHTQPEDAIFFSSIMWSCYSVQGVACNKILVMQSDALQHGHCMLSKIRTSCLILRQFAKNPANIHFWRVILIPTYFSTEQGAQNFVPILTHPYFRTHEGRSRQNLPLRSSAPTGLPSTNPTWRSIARRPTQSTRKNISSYVQIT